MYSFQTISLRGRRGHLPNVHTKSFNIKDLHRLHELRAFIWCWRSFIYLSFILNYVFFSLQIHLFRVCRYQDDNNVNGKKFIATFFTSEGLNLSKDGLKSDFGCWAKSKWDWTRDWQTCKQTEKKLHSHTHSGTAMRFLPFVLHLPVCACYIAYYSDCCCYSRYCLGSCFFSLLLISNNLKEGKNLLSHLHSMRRIRIDLFYILISFCHAFVNLTRWQCNQRIRPCTSCTLDRQILLFSHNFLILMYGI